MAVFGQMAVDSAERDCVSVCKTRKRNAIHLFIRVGDRVRVRVRAAGLVWNHWNWHASLV
jgi:hypothetical protein